MRKLASIQKIERIDPIPGKDQIGLAHVCGWNVIVRYEQFLPGDLCIYVEIDSVLPEKPEFEFLRSKKFRIKTLKMAGVISEGICFPLSILPERSLPYNIGDDVTDILGITKYDEYNEVTPTLPKQKKSALRRFLFQYFPKMAKLIFGGNSKERRGFPDEVSQTDEERVQNIDYEGLRNQNLRYEVREKIDGQSGTFLLRRNKGLIGLIHKYEFIVCSRRLRIPKPDGSSWWSVALKYNIEKVLHSLIKGADWVCIQGECIGPGIQGNPYNVTDFDLYCFNLIYPEGRIPGVQAEDMVKEYGLKWVPLIDAEFKLPNNCDDMLEFAHGTSKLANVLREGVVVRNYEKRISFKAVDRLYLIRHDK